MKRLLLALLGVWLFAAPLLAQPHPNLERGFQPEKIYSHGDLDSVSLENGNLSITLPLGISYPVGGGFSYSLSLVYNSKVWDFVERYDGATGETASEAVPNRLSNAALGWSVSLGRLLDPNEPVNQHGITDWVYLSPDGSEHLFYDQLHSSDTETDPGNAFTYTRDGSYLRMHKITSNLRVIEFPNGEIHSFQRCGTPCPAPLGRWNLSQIRDRFGNGVNVSYSSDGSTWTLTDTLTQAGTSTPLRTHKILFEADRFPGGVSSFYKKRLKSITLQGFAGQAMTYRFGYVAVTLDKPCGQTLATNRTVVTSLLEKVTLPDNTFYKFDYQTAGTDYDTCHSHGMIRQMSLPTLGRVHWTFADTEIPVEACSYREWYKKSAGVVERQTQDAGGNLIGRHLYSRAPSTPPAIPNGRCDQPMRRYRAPSEELKVTVQTPLNDREVYYFSIYPGVVHGTYSGPFQRAESGLPLTRNQADATGSRFLSSEIYDCDASGNNCQRVRSRYVRYERDQAMGVCNLEELTPPCTDLLRRQASERTVYADDANHYADTDRSDFDGFGHFRSEATGGDFDAANQRTFTTLYNPGVATWPTSSAWVLNTFTESRVIEGGSTVLTQSCFESSTGFLLRQRQVKSLAAILSAKDVVNAFSRDASGNRTLERSFGGDTQTVGMTADLCSLSLPATDLYRTAHTYENGVEKTRQSQNADGSSLGFLSLDRTVDASGLVEATRDTAGLATHYRYDNMARLTSIEPSQDAWTTYSYFLADPDPNTFHLASVKVLRAPNGGTGTPLARQDFLFDALGRPVTEARDMPTGPTAVRVTAYNAAGLKASVSEWETGVPSHLTLYQDYDPFGRPRTIVPPEGSGHAVSLSYEGVRKKTRTLKVGNAQNADGTISEVDATTTEVYDRQGRLFRVREFSMPDNTELVTQYSYHPLGLLASVTYNNVTPSQSRTFSYDGRGFLSSEQHPELGSSGNGTISYSYDARGHAVRRLEGATSGARDLTFEYDRAERLLKVRETAGTTPRVYKEFTYAADNDGSNHRKGKLETAVRHNWVTNPATSSLVDVTVTETYRYGELEGRIAQRTTTLSSGPSFFQAFSYTPLGEPSGLLYPGCTHTACSGTGPARSLSFSYSQGRLTSVDDFATLGYHANGMVKTVTHANGVVDTYALDATARPRPASITTSGVSPPAQNWSSGTYQYDGAGNVVKVGSDVFLYDLASRLVRGSLPSVSANAVQEAKFDAWGNMVELKTAGTTQTFQIDKLTNHLSAGASYDTGGNVVSWGTFTNTFDPFNQRVASGNRTYLYTADDERIYTLEWNGTFTTSNEWWTLRDLSGRVLREYLSHGNVAGQWSWTKDYVYRGGQPLASVAPGSVGTLHYTLDHLGSPRLITDATATRIALHTYYPFGGEATSSAQDAEKLKFTGHERDTNGAGTLDDLDYMHARYCSPGLGRFLSVDPANSSGPSQSQSWNRYAYTRNNPLKFVDPNGEDVVWFARDDSGNDRITNFGHSALRVVGKNYDVTFDFGRYGKTSGLFGTTGQGILKIWLDFSGFLRNQNPEGSSVGVRYATPEAFDAAVIEYFGQLTAEGVFEDYGAGFERWNLAQEYNVFSHNCTTICSDALTFALTREGSGREQDQLRRDLLSWYSVINDPRTIYGLLTKERDLGNGRVEVYFSFRAEPRR